ncbi:MAG: O-antigen ligase family protein [Candidatus Blackburnbacteria bacterium]|nr:O-antigen ligase family protein [Candidatus Blackburnbacteria bacterium]
MSTLLIWLLFLYLAAFPFGQLFRFEILPPITLHLVDIIAGFFVFFWFVWVLRRKYFNSSPLKLEFLSFLLVAGFSLALGATKVMWQEVFVGLLYWLRFAVYILFYFAVWDLTRVNSRLRTKLFNSLLVLGIFISIFGLFQYLVFPDLRILLSYGWDEHYFRLVGTFLDPGFTGILLVFFTILIFSQGEWGRGKWSRWPLGLLGITSLLLTYSRASYLAFLMALLLFNIVRPNTVFVLVALVLFLLGVAVLPRPGGEGVRLERTSTIFARFEGYKRAWEVGKENPLFGVGFNLYGFAFPTADDCGSIDKERPCHSAAGADSSLLFVFATGGIVGLIAYLYLWLRILVLGWRKRFTGAGLALLLSSIALLIHSNFTNSLFYPWVLGWQAILLGIQED